MRELIFSEGDFALYKELGIGRENTPWEGLVVKSSGAADKHVVEVRLYSIGMPAFVGKSVKYKYDPNETDVAHGMRSVRDSFSDTEEYIEVLKSALSFAKRVNQYIIDNDWT